MTREAFLSLVLVFGAACGGGGGEGQSGADAAPDSSAPDASGGGGEAATIGSEGGSVGAGDGEIAGASVDIPAGALDEDVEITVEPGTDVDSGEAVVAGPAVRFGPEGQVFAVPVEVTIPYDPARVPSGAESSLAILKRSDATGEMTVLTAQDVTIDAGESLASVEVTSFSTFQAAYEVEPVESGLLNVLAWGMSLGPSLTEREAPEAIGAWLWDGTVALEGSSAPISVVETFLRMPIVKELAFEPYLDVKEDPRSLEPPLLGLGDGRALVDTRLLGAISASADVIAWSIMQGQVDGSSEAHADSALLVGFERGSDLTSTVVAGDYHVRFVGLDIEGDRGTGSDQGVFLSDLAASASFDGIDAVTITAPAGEVMELQLPVAAQLEAPAQGAVLRAASTGLDALAAGYSVSASGELELDGSISGYVRPDGEALMLRLAGPNGNDPPDQGSSMLIVGIEQGSGLNDAHLEGDYNIIGFANRLREDSGDGIVSMSSNINLTGSFDGAGAATFEAPSFPMFHYRDPMVDSPQDGRPEFSEAAETLSPGGTYSVAEDGALTLGDWSGAVTPDGTMFIATSSGGTADEHTQYVFIGIKR